MDQDDYNELFGVMPEGGQEPETGQEQGTALVASSGGPHPSSGGTTPAADAREDSPPPSTETEEPQPEERETGPIQSGPPPEPSEGRTAPTSDARVGQALPPEEVAKKAIDEAFALSGLKNPYTGQPITSKAEYDAYRERFEAERREQVLKQTGMTQEEFQRFVQELPEVRQARQAKEEMEKAAREAREAAARVKVNEQLKEISALDPSVKSLEDLTKMPTYPQFYELVKRGNTLTDAFRLANFDVLAQRSAAGARQAAVNSARSKEHLAETRTRGGGAVSVPAEVREQYKLFSPDATEEEIQKHYQRYHKEGK